MEIFLQIAREKHKKETRDSRLCRNGSRLYRESGAEASLFPFVTFHGQGFAVIQSRIPRSYIDALLCQDHN